MSISRCQRLGIAISMALGMALSITLLTGTLAQAIAKDTVRTLHIGVETKRIPYSYKGQGSTGKGLLADYLQSVCKSAKFDCKIWSNSFDGLVDELKRARVDAMVVIDAIVFSDIDTIKLSDPLCQLEPIFIQPRSAPQRETADAFAALHIGVLGNSVMHFYLLEKYGAETRLKNYPVLEAGIFDLTSGRIDAIFTDKLFFQTRVLNTPYGRANHPQQLIDVTVDLTVAELKDKSEDNLKDLPAGLPVKVAKGSVKFAPYVTLAVNDFETTLLKTLNTAIQAQGATPTCTSLAEELAQPAAD